MKKKKRDSKMPVGKLTRVKDDLPSPAELAVAEETVKKVGKARGQTNNHENGI